MPHHKATLILSPSPCLNKKWKIAKLKCLILNRLSLLLLRVYYVYILKFPHCIFIILFQFPSLFLFFFKPLHQNVFWPSSKLKHVQKFLKHSNNCKLGCAAQAGTLLLSRSLSLLNKKYFHWKEREKGIFATYRRSEIGHFSFTERGNVKIVWILTTCMRKTMNCRMAIKLIVTFTSQKKICSFYRIARLLSLKPQEKPNPSSSRFISITM